MANKALATLFLWILSQTLLAVDLPDDFTARYEVEKYSTVIAEMSLSLEHQEQGILYQSKTRPRGLLALLSGDKIDESSHLKITENGQLQLLDYHYTRKERPRDNQQYELQWQEQQVQVHGRYRNKDIQLESQGPIWDGLSVQLALMLDISDDAVFNTQYNYTIIDDGQLKNYQFEYLSKESLRIGNKRYQTLKIKRQHDSKGKRISYFWLAPELHKLPVKIQQYKNGKLNLNMQLKDFKQIHHD